MRPSPTGFVGRVLPHETSPQVVKEQTFLVSLFIEAERKEVIAIHAKGRIEALEIVNYWNRDLMIRGIKDTLYTLSPIEPK